MKKLFALSALLLTGTACMETPTGVTPSDPITANFITVWENYEVNYPEFTMKSLNWELMYSKYLPIAQAAETAEELMMNAVFPMLAELKDAHVSIWNPQNIKFRTYVADNQANYDMGVLLAKYLLPAEFNGWKKGIGYCNPDLLPYLSIKSWLGDLNMVRLDEFIALCWDKPAIIIDVRMNGGGNNFRCKWVVGRFTHEQEPFPGWTARFRSGPDYDDCEYIVANIIAAGPLQYDGTIILLIGEMCASSNEDFILGMNELPNVILVGDTTMGALTCPTHVELPNGWSYTAISWSVRSAREEPIEWFGITPDIYVEATEEDFEQGIDPVLEYAIGMVEDLNQ